VHDETRAGLATALIGIAREKGVSGFIGDGANRWPGVHRLDAARLFRLALEAAPAGSRLHAVGDEGVPLHEIAGAIGRGLDLPALSVTAEEADDHFGFLSLVVPLDNPTSSVFTRQLLGWRPTHPGLIVDLEGRGHSSSRTPLIRSTCRDLHRRLLRRTLDEVATRIRLGVLFDPQRLNMQRVSLVPSRRTRHRCGRCRSRPRR
jgi:hypothetical protein